MRLFRFLSLQACLSIGIRSLALAVLLSSTFILTAPEASAQSGEDAGKITGRVLNARTGRYVNQAKVTIQGTSTQEFTNQFGEYEIYGLQPGVYTVHVDFTGMARQTERVTVTAGQTVTQNFTMGMRREDQSEEGEVFELAEFVVDANDFQSMQEIAIQEERYSVNLKNVVSADAYGNVAQGNIGEFVKFIPGVQVNYGGEYASGADASSISIRGYGAEQTGVTIDGIPVSNAQPGSLTRTVGLDMLSINNAARVEVIKVPTPDQPEASIAGTVNLVSKTAFEYPEPKLSYRVYVSINSENTDFFKKTPGPVNEATYKTLPGLDLTYAWPINDKIGFTFTLATSNQYNENHSFDADWQTSSRDDPVPRFIEPDGTVIEPVYPDATRPYLNNISISDAPRFSHRHSGAIKMDYRPFDGVLITANYQASIFDSREADRIFEMNAGGYNIETYGEDFMISQEGNGKSDLIVRALDRDGITHTAYLKLSYIKGPWDFRSHASYSKSEGNLLSTENGHFSDIQVGMGGINRAEFRDIRNGVPGTVEYYDDENNLIDPASLDSYVISGYDPSDPQASSLRVLAGETRSSNEINTYKVDLRRDIDFLPFDWMSLAVKVGAYQEETTEEKTGPGTGYGFQYLGESGVALNLGDFRDDGYTGVSPGFGFEPREWPDTYKVYKFYKENPSAFSDTHDIPRVNENGDLENTVAANNWISYVNTQKSVTETNTDWYWQIETKFFNNRLDIVGGMRQSTSKREGRTRFRDNDYQYLRSGEDTNGDGRLDVLDVQEGGAISLMNPQVLEVSEMQALEARGVTYGDGTPFRAGFSYTGEPMLIKTLDLGRLGTRDIYYQDVFGVDQGYVISGSLAEQQLFLIPNYQINEESRGRPSPVVSASYDLTDAIVLRASWARSYAKRDFEGAFGLLTSGGVQINQSSREIVITNPDLKPWEADSYDFGVSYYTNSGGKFSVSYFLKQERDHHVSVTIPVEESNYQQVLTDFGLPPDPSYYLDQWIIRTTENGDGTAETTGYELEVSQGLGILGDWGKYFYVYASYSWKERTQSETVEGDPVGPSADEFAAGGINFNYGRYSARVNATWRTERFLRGTSIGVLRDPTMHRNATIDGEKNEIRVPASLIEPAEVKIDVSLSVRLFKNFSMDISAKNVTNSEQERIFKSEDDSYPFYAEVDSRKEFGVQYTIGFSGEF